MLWEEEDMIIEMSHKTAERYRRFSDWIKVEKAVKRYINEGNSTFSISIGGFDVNFDETKMDSEGNSSSNQKGENE